MVLGWAFTRVGRCIGQGPGHNRPAKPLRQTRQDAAPGTADGLAPDGHISQGSAFAARGCRVALRADWQRHAAVRTDPVPPHTSLAATLHGLFGFVPLTARDAAPDLRGVLASAPVGDGPPFIAAPAVLPVSPLVAHAAANISAHVRAFLGLAQARHGGFSCWLPDVWTAVSTPAVRSRRPPASRRSAVPAGLATDCGSTGAAHCRRRCAGNGPPRHGSLPHG